MVPCKNPSNPRANIFIVINLGCEMLYVIDQRLQAQQIDKAKATQVFHEISAILLNPRFTESIINDSIREHSQLLTPQNCRIMMNNIAAGSLMRLDVTSMDKLWNLMTMIYKWQLFVSQHPFQLLDNTFRHLNSVTKLYPDEKIATQIDYVKNMVLDFWNSFNDETQCEIYYTNKAWLQNFNTKISLLIRLGFQLNDGSFLPRVKESYFNDFVQSAGDNIYTLSVDIAAQRRQELLPVCPTVGAARHNIAQLHAEILGTLEQKAIGLADNDGWHIQQEIQQTCTPNGCTIAAYDARAQDQLPKSMMELGVFTQAVPHIAGNNEENVTTDELVSVNTVYNRNVAVPNEIGYESSLEASLNKNLLDIYSKIH